MLKLSVSTKKPPADYSSCEAISASGDCGVSFMRKAAKNGPCTGSAVLHRFMRRRFFGMRYAPRLPFGSRGAASYFVLLQPVQLSSGLMHGSFFPGKNASIGKSIWLKTSQGLSVLVPPTGGQVFDGTQ